MKQRKMSSLQTYCLLKATTSFDVLKAKWRGVGHSPHPSNLGFLIVCDV